MTIVSRVSRVSRLAVFCGCCVVFWIPCATVRCAENANAGFQLPAPDTRAQLFPRLAFDGRSTYLLVWQQGRQYYQQQEGDIFALRLNASGQPLDRRPIRICGAAGSQERPRVGYSGKHFLVVWQDLRNGKDWDLYGMRLADNGRPMDPGDGILIAGGPGNQAGAAVASAPGGWLVVWQHYDGRYYVLRAALVGETGDVGPVQTLSFRGKDLHGGNLALGATGGHWLLSWKDELAWRPGPGMITRRFARLAIAGTTVRVEEVRRSPSVILGRKGGDFVGGHDAGMAFVGWGEIGRGRLIPQGAVFDAGSAIPRLNPNADPNPGISGWNTERVFTLFARHAQVEGPLAAAFGGGRYLVAGRTRTRIGRGDRIQYRIVGSQFDPSGRRLSDPARLPVFDQSLHPLADPALSFGPNGFILVFEQEDGPEKHRLRIKRLALP